ncbi:MAG: DUF3078 domain-containing protein [Bacteroidaceae bacterium]|nr:DUF3078 domain-containing protein [Bacteroidaceae bacterium]
MKRKMFLGSLLLCCASWMMGQQTVQVDSLVQMEAQTDSVVAINDSVMLISTDSDVMPDSVLAVQADSVAAQKQTDPTAIALRPLTQTEIDSTILVLEQVKSLTDKISEQSLLDAFLVKEVFSDTAVVNKYNRLLEEMVVQYAAEVESISVNDTVHVNPIYFRLFAPLTLYKSPITQAMSIDAYPAVTLEDSLRLAAMASGQDLRLLNELDRVLLSTYLASPSLVGITEDELMASQNFSGEAMKKMSESVKIEVPTASVAPLTDTKPQAVTEVVVQKPNFWVTKGNFSTQVTESFFSPNWYQGGINNLNVLSMLTLEANYNNKRKVQWDNKLDARLGFYQNQGEDIQSNQDLLRLTSKLNLKAIRNWNYAIEAQGNTQMLNHYKGSDRSSGLKSGFLSPADVSFTVGMDFKKNFNKGSVSIYPGPLSFKMTYVGIEKLSADYGIEEGKKMRYDLGSKLEVNFDYKITKDISYKTRFYYFTGRYEYVQMDWENTLNFQVSKYISTKLFFHTRFDDLVDIKPENANWGFFQFKQYLMLGLNYAW